jgi:hypothetical protein
MTIQQQLKSLRDRRSNLIRQYGARGEMDPQSSMLGGLSPAALELAEVRRQIALLEKPRVRWISGQTGTWWIETALINNVVYKIARDNHGFFYVVRGTDFVADGFRSRRAARRAAIKDAKG